MNGRRAIPKPRVGGSSPSRGTTPFPGLQAKNGLTDQPWQAGKGVRAAPLPPICRHLITASRPPRGTTTAARTPVGKGGSLARLLLRSPLA
jgi:hypothetical protein